MPVLPNMVYTFPKEKDNKAKKFLASLLLFDL